MMRLGDVAIINPYEHISKGTKGKKVNMDALTPFTRKIPLYVNGIYKGGAKFRNGDTLVARITPCLENGKTAFVDFLEADEIGFGSTEFIVVREKINITDKVFLYYLSRSKHFRDVAIKSMTGTSGRQRVQIDEIRKYQFIAPSLPEQKTIAEILSSLDDKIELLHRQNKTLEDMAQTLFRKWFIEDADEEWESVKLGDVITAKGGTTPSTKENTYWNGDIHWATPKDLSNHKSVFLFGTERKITKPGLDKISSGLLPIGTVLLSSRAPIGYLAITGVPVAINQGYIAILCDKCLPTYFVYLWCKINMEAIENAGNGSVFQEIPKSIFRSLGIVIPPLKKILLFNTMVEPHFGKIRNNQIQIRTLENLRDTLLPNLMRGAVEV